MTALSSAQTTTFTDTGGVGPRTRLFPRAASLTDALLEPSSSAIAAQELADIRARMVASLEEVLGAFPTSQRLQVTAYDVVSALEQRGEARDFTQDADGDVTGDSGFVPSPFLCRRSIGIAAVRRCARGRASSPSSAVREVIESALDDLKISSPSVSAPRAPWWAQWYEGLTPGARAVVEAEAVTWATQLWTALEWNRFSRPAVIGEGDDWWRPPGRSQVAFKGRVELKAWAGPRQAFLVIGSRSPSTNWRTALAFPALVAAFARGERCAPGRVVGLWPQSGIVRVHPIDTAALCEAADAAVAAVHARLQKEPTS